MRLLASCRQLQSVPDGYMWDVWDTVTYQVDIYPTKYNFVERVKIDFNIGACLVTLARYGKNHTKNR